MRASRFTGQRSNGNRQHEHGRHRQVPRGKQGHVQQTDSQECRAESSLAKHRDDAENGDDKEDLYIQRTVGVKAETPELGDVIHQVIVLEVRKDVFVEMPAVGINEGGQQG